MTVVATVRSWHSEDGWGVLDSAETPGGCWAGFAAIPIDGYAELRAGETVWLVWESGEQDGYAYRAVRVWTSDPGEHCVDARAPANAEPSRQDAAYHSSLRIRRT